MATGENWIDDNNVDARVDLQPGFASTNVTPKKRKKTKKEPIGFYSRKKKG